MTMFLIIIITNGCLEKMFAIVMVIPLAEVCTQHDVNLQQ